MLEYKHKGVGGETPFTPLKGVAWWWWVLSVIVALAPPCLSFYFLSPSTFWERLIAAGVAIFIAFFSCILAGIVVLIGVPD